MRIDDQPIRAVALGVLLALSAIVVLSTASVFYQRALLAHGATSMLPTVADSLPSSHIMLGIMLLGWASLLLAGIVTGRRVKAHGWFYGGIAGTITWLLMTIIVSIVSIANAQTFGLDFGEFVNGVIAITLTAIGGFWGSKRTASQRQRL